LNRFLMIGLAVVMCFIIACPGITFASETKAPKPAPGKPQGEETVLDKLWGLAVPKLKAKIGAIDPVFLDATVSIFDQLYARETKLNLKTRELCTIAILASLGKSEELDLHLAAAFRMGWKFNELREVMILSAIPAGWPASLDALRSLYKWCQMHKVPLAPAEPLPKDYASTDWYKKGYDKGVKLFGKQKWENYLSKFSKLDPDFARFTVANLYGKLFCRSILDDKTKELCMVASFAALKSKANLKLHIIGAKNSGANVDEIKELLMHCGIYAGQEASYKAARVFAKMQ
jgi:4-carboxymuconolactone decarboxylase